jgi:hypothetical protein
MSLEAGTASATRTADAAIVDDRRPLPARMFLVLVAIVFGAVGNLVSLVYGLDEGDISVDWAAKHQSAWAASTYGTALAAMGLIALLAAVCALVRRRGATWATVSLAVGSLGTFLYAVSAAIPVAIIGMGTQTVVSSSDASALVDYLGKHDMTQAGIAFPGFLLLLVTQITVTVALIRSRAVPLWVPIVFIAGGVVNTVFAGNGAVTAALTIPQIVVEIVIGWYAWKRSTA